MYPWRVVGQRSTLSPGKSTDRVRSSRNYSLRYSLLLICVDDVASSQVPFSSFRMYTYHCPFEAVLALNRKKSANGIVIIYLLDSSVTQCGDAE